MAGFNDGSGLSPGDPCHMYIKPEFRHGMVTSAQYWKSRRLTRPKLSKIGAFWIEFETSSIAAEHVYGIVRRMGLPGRGAMSDDTFRREIFFRVNREALQTLLRAKMAAVAALMKPKV